MHGHLNVNLSRCTVTWTSIYHDARSPERQFITMHGHLNVHLSRCTVTWTSIYHDARSPERQFITMHGHLNVKCVWRLQVDHKTNVYTSSCVDFFLDTLSWSSSSPHFTEFRVSMLCSQEPAKKRLHKEKLALKSVYKNDCLCALVSSLFMYFAREYGRWYSAWHWPASVEGSVVTAVSGSPYISHKRAGSGILLYCTIFLDVRYKSAHGICSAAIWWSVACHIHCNPNVDVTRQCHCTEGHVASCCVALCTVLLLLLCRNTQTGVERTAEFPVHTSFQTNYPCYQLDGVEVYMRWCRSDAPPSRWQTPPWTMFHYWRFLGDFSHHTGRWRHRTLKSVDFRMPVLNRAGWRSRCSD